METIETVNIFEEYEKMKADNERLREALKKITKVRYYGPQGPYKESHEMHEIANQALKGGE
jgi:hypothetical protein